MWKHSNLIIQRSTNRFNYIADLKFWVRGAIKMQWNKPQWYWIWANIPSSKVEVLFNAKPHLTFMGSKMFWKTKICFIIFYFCIEYYIEQFTDRYIHSGYLMLQEMLIKMNYIAKFYYYDHNSVSIYICPLRQTTELWRWRAIRRSKKKCRETL